MNVAKTHEQYDQINMNSDNIVVWYCLANKGEKGYYSSLPNDATNAYYIFSRGNVTYSGAGHTSGNNYLADNSGNVGNQYENEAKLFVNTMIAAYRTANEKPSVSFTETADGTAKKNYLFLSTDSGSSGDVLLSTQAADADEKTVFFKITDPNLNTDKKIAVSLSYAADGGTPVPLAAPCLYAGRQADHRGRPHGPDRRPRLSVRAAGRRCGGPPGGHERGRPRRPYDHGHNDDRGRDLYRHRHAPDPQDRPVPAELSAIKKLPPSGGSFFWRFTDFGPRSGAARRRRGRAVPRGPPRAACP
jgi:hypothetical protein